MPRLDQSDAQYLKSIEDSVEKLLSKEDYKAAIKEYRKGIAYGENKGKPLIASFCYNSIGDIYYDRAEFDKAYEEYKKTLELNPTNSHALYRMEKILRQKGKKEEAKVLIERADETAMDFYYVSSAMEFEREDKFDKELEEYEKGINYAKRQNKTSLSAFYHSLKGQAYIRIGDFENALKEFNEGIKIDPENHYCKEGIKRVDVFKGDSVR
jgi:tetratricopeptide (TPR) repeat protein